MPLCTTCQSPIVAGTRVCPTCHALQPAVVTPPRMRPPLDLGYGKVTFDTKLGEGATAIVWRGELTRSRGLSAAGNAETIVAVKELRPEQRDRGRALFRNEAEALRAIDHPNVVRLIDVVEVDREAAMIFEYVEGETLEALIARQMKRSRADGASSLAGLSYGFAWSVFDQLLAALGATHQADRVHADVKPGNLLLRSDSVVKLTDFGLVRRIKAASTAAEAGAGTSAYISPEQALGQPLDERSDLYSAASMLFEMLAGRTAFDTEGRNELAVRMDQVHRAPPPLRAFLPDAPPALDGLFARALAKDPRQRFANAHEMREAFGTIMQLAGRVHGRRR